jgi:hypothetical protein
MKEKLSEHIICDWKITNKIKISPSKYNIISVCFFLIKGKTENDKYIKGITEIIQDFMILETYKLRIYFDESVKEILLNILRSVNKRILDNIEFFQYNIEFMKEDQIYHNGYIGTLIRFLPLFDNKIHKVDKCIVLDIDNKITNVYKKVIDNCDKNNINVCYRSRYGYSLKDRLLCLSDKIIYDYPIIASFIYKSYVDIPSTLLSDFFENIFYKNDNIIIKRCNLKKYDYGVDEVFINKYFLNYIYNRITFAPVIFNYYNIFQSILSYIFVIKSLDEINKFIYFMNIFFILLNINIKFNNYKNGNIKKIKYKINSILRKNNTIINNKINELFYNNKISEVIDQINLLKQEQLEKQNKRKNNKKEIFFDIFLNSIINNLNNVKNDKILLVKISKNSIKKIYI